MDDWLGRERQDPAVAAREFLLKFTIDTQSLTNQLIIIAKCLVIFGSFDNF